MDIFGKRKGITGHKISTQRTIAHSLKKFIHHSPFKKSLAFIRITLEILIHLNSRKKFSLNAKPFARNLVERTSRELFYNSNLAITIYLK